MFNNDDTVKSTIFYRNMNGIIVKAYIMLDGTTVICEHSHPNNGATYYLETTIDELERMQKENPLTRI